MHNTVFNEYDVEMMLTRYSCWCCPVDERVYRYGDWQNHQQAIQYEMVRHAQALLIQAN